MIQGNMPADVPAEVRTPTSGEAGTSLGRLTSVDVLRGLVMVIMALDHTRDFFSNSANLFDPTDLTHTSPILFFTRWITHFSPCYLRPIGPIGIKSCSKAAGR